MQKGIYKPKDTLTYLKVEDQVSCWYPQYVTYAYRSVEQGALASLKYSSGGPVCACVLYIYTHQLVYVCLYSSRLLVDQ